MSANNECNGDPDKMMVAEMPSDHPLVTIITPTYNRDSFLDETIESVLSQDYPCIEYIVLDDGSNDHTPQVLDKYKTRIITVTHPNMGETRTVNKGFSISRGDILCVVNSDDPLMPGAVSAAVTLLHNRPDTMVVYMDWYAIGPNSEILYEQKMREYDIFNMLTEFNISMGPGTFFRRRLFDLIGMRDPALRYTGDLDFWFRAALHTKFGHIRKPLATHRIHATSACVADRGAQQADELLKVVKKVYTNPKLPDQLKRLHGGVLSWVHFVATYYCGDDWRARRKHHIASIIYNPLYWITKVGSRVRSVFRSQISRLKAVGIHIARKALYVCFRIGYHCLRPFLRMMRRTLVGPSTKAVTHKFALVSSYLPPSWSGGAVVIGRLLQGIDQGQYCLISRENYEDYDDADGFIPRLASRYYCIPDQQRIPGGRFGSAIHWARSLWVVFRRGCRISRVLLQERCESVVVTTGDLLEFPAAFLASRLAGCRCFPYFFDDYTYQWWAEPRMVAMAAFFESFIIPRSAGVIVPNEFMEEEIKRRYRVPCSIVRNPCLSRDTPASSVPFPANPGEIRIIFTGAVYHLNYETFRNIMAAIELIDNPELRLHLYTAQPLEALSANGISGKHVVIHRHVPPQKVAMIQESADILLLPFSFASAAAPLVKTSATGKLAEYLASGRPVLANVADDSFLAWYLTKHECGMVVSSDDPAMLAKAFRRLIDDSELRNTITRNGLMRARIDFNPTDARNSFLRAMGLFQ